MIDIHGLPLSQALARLEAAGIGPVSVLESRGPGRPAEGGTLRVVRANEQGCALVVCSFLDTLPRDEEDNHGPVEA